MIPEMFGLDGCEADGRVAKTKMQEVHNEVSHSCRVADQSRGARVVLRCQESMVVSSVVEASTHQVTMTFWIRSTRM